MGPSALSSMEEPCTKAPAAIITSLSYPGIAQGSGGYVAVYRGGSLDPPAEGDHRFRAAKGHCLDNVMPRLGTVGNHRKSQSLVNIGGKNSPLQGGSRHRGRQGKSPDRRTDSHREWLPLLCPVPERSAAPPRSPHTPLFLRYNRR